MKRLFYTATDLNDVEEISEEVHARGIDDEHFYVVSRDSDGIKNHHLHGGISIESTDLLGGRKRSKIVAAAILMAGLLGIGLLSNELSSAYSISNSPIVILLLLCLAIAYVVNIIGASFDSYFLTLFNRHIDAGEALLIIDVENTQSERIKTVLRHHPKAHFLADCSNIGSPIPN